MKRHEIEFEFTAAEIQGACAKQVVHHMERVTYWAKEHADAQKQALENGEAAVELEDPLYAPSSGYSNKMAMHRTRAMETKRKLEEHRAKAAEFRAWGALFSRLTGQLGGLHYDDVIFFGLTEAKTS